MKILNLFYSSTGNTEKVAKSIEKTTQSRGHDVKTLQVTPETKDIEILDFDFVFNGSGVYRWLPGKPMISLYEKLVTKYSDKNGIEYGGPKRLGKNAVVYCTYGGVHTGRKEALPAVKYMKQMFEYLGFEILGEWYVVGKYPEKMKEASKKEG